VPGGAVAAVALAAGGTTIATAGADGAVRLWQAGGSPMTLTSAGPALSGLAGDVTTLAFSPDGGTLAAAAVKAVGLWDVRQPGHPALLGTPLSGPSGQVLSVAFNPAGSSLAAGTIDGSTWLWNVTAPAHPVLVANLLAAGGQVTDVAFSPSGGQLAAANGNGVHLWTTSPAAALSGICANLGQALTPMEWAGSVPGVAYQAPCPAG
jgi:WD40 repeat protein